MFNVFSPLFKLVRNLRRVVSDCLSFFASIGRPRLALAAENLFLRKQLALFREREKRALPTTPADRFVFSKLAHWFDWRSALIIVKPATLIGWHRAAFSRFWRWKSRPVGRPRVTAEVRDLIRRLATENPTWGEKRMADELLLKLQIRLSPRTVAKYRKQLPGPRRSRDQRWSTFLKNHAQAIVACDFFTVVTATFRIIYVFVALEIGSRRLVHFHATEHPTAEWTLQQLREGLPGDQEYKFLLHDRHKTFSAGLDEEVERWGITVLKSPAHAPTANAFCERLIGSIRRECLDYLIPLNESHLKCSLREWVRHYNSGRPHQSLGPGIPNQVEHTLQIDHDHKSTSPNRRVLAKPILGGLHHEYRWADAA
jgi:transposase InsO family protein